MAVKEFKYRGYTIEELKKMDRAKLLELAPSGVRRRLTRGMEIDRKIKNAISNIGKVESSKKNIETHRRDIIITPDMIGLKLMVYTGKAFENVEIKDEMLWHYLGEFVDTRKRPVHSKAGIGATRSSKNVGKK